MKMHDISYFLIEFDEMQIKSVFPWFMLVCVFESFKMLADCPIAEISEGDLVVFVVLLFDRIEGRLWIIDLHSIFRIEWNSRSKLLFGDHPIVAFVLAFKQAPVLVVLPQINEEEFELSL